MENPNWYEKYRPTTFDNFYWEDDNLKNKFLSWKNDPIKLPHLIFHGKPGVGKTTLAKLIKTQIDCEFLEINASLDNGVDVIRRIIEYCENGGFSAIKVVFFDEAERLTLDAQQGLRKTIEDYGAYVRFIFACNEINRIIDPLRSRFQEFTFKGLSEDTFLDKLLSILIDENIDVSDTDFVGMLIDKIYRKFYPDLRRSINMLQKCVLDGKLIDVVDTSVLNNSELEDQASLLFSNFSVSTARTFVTTLKPNEYEEFYHVLYHNSNKLFGDVEDQALIIIADHIYRHKLVGLPDINLMACIIKLYMIKDDNKSNEN